MTQTRSLPAPATWPSGSARTDRASRFVDRPRLVEHVHDGARGPLTVVTAPAGYGKSVVLGQWAARQRGRRIARVTLRPGESAARLAARLVAALGGLGAWVDPESLASVGCDGLGLGEHFVAATVAGLEQVRGGVLVVDGLDASVDPTLADDVRALFGRSLSGLHVVLVQRSRWRTPQHLDRGCEYVCLNEADLAFAPDEARRLVREVAGRDLSNRQLEALLERTEGWAVGLRLAAIALRRSVVPDAEIESLTGDDRHLAGYLGDEVLAGQPARVRRFLMRTSVLDRLCGPLCDALTGDADGDMTLRHLEARGLFTSRDGVDDAWFRYHRLFRDFLRRGLRRREPDVEAALLSRAAEWHLDRDEPGPAFRYLAEAGDAAHILELIDRCGRSMFERGAAGEVLHWLDAVPGSRDPHRPDLAIRRAYLQTMMGNTRVAGQLVHEIDRGHLAVGDQIAIDALRATWAFWDGSPASVIRAADAVLAAIDDVDPDELPDVFGLTTPASLRIMAAGARARALWCLGDIAASRRALTALVHQRVTYPPWRARSLGALALLEAWAGNLRLAERHAGRALSVATASHLLKHPATIDARLAIAHVARERADLHRADALLAEVDMLATRARQPVMLAMLSLERALWQLAAGRPECGLAELERNRATGDAPPPLSIETRQRAAEVRLLLALGDSERARAVLDGAMPAGAPAPDVAAVSVQVAVARHDLESAVAHLDGWHPDDAEPRARLERQLWAAVLDAEAGDRARARRRTALLVARAQVEGHVRLFLDAGRPAERLLRMLHHASPSPYVLHLLHSAQSTRGLPTEGGLVGLSEREREVVPYLPTPLSNAEIAGQLYISVNTLKTHLRSIYRKLGVTGRRDAIQRAEDLGIA